MHFILHACNLPTKPNYALYQNSRTEHYRQLCRDIERAVYLLRTIFSTINRHTVLESLSKFGRVKSYVNIWRICSNINIAYRTRFHCEHTCTGHPDAVYVYQQSQGRLFRFDKMHASDRMDRISAAHAQVLTVVHIPGGRYTSACQKEVLWIIQVCGYTKPFLHDLCTMSAVESIYH